MKKFKAGDWIIGTKGNRYGLTNSNTILEVIERGEEEEEDDERYLGENNHFVRTKVVVSFYWDVNEGDRFGALEDNKFRKVTPEDIIRFNVARRRFREI